MKLSPREMGLGFATLAVLLAAGTWMWAEPRFAALEEVRKQKQSSREIIQRSEMLLSREEQWRERVERLRESLPEYADDERVASTIMKTLEARAEEAGIELLKATPEKERPVGELYEITINYRWEGSLNSLVRFLYNLQSKSVNMEIGKLSASPASRPGEQLRLKGGLTVDVAYTRAVRDEGGEVADAEEE